MVVDHTQSCHRDNEKINLSQTVGYIIGTIVQYLKVEAMAFLLFEPVKKVYFTVVAASGGFN
jgi:hypothetical protein